MNSVAQMVSFFESNSKNVKPKKKVKSPPKLVIPSQMKQRIIMPKGGIPKDYYASSYKNPRPKSPRYIRNVDIAKPQKLDKEKIKNNMENMKQLLEQKGIYKRPFIIEPPNYHQNQDDQDNQINQNNEINQGNQDNQNNQENKNNQINQNQNINKNKSNLNNKNNQNNKVEGLFSHNKFLAAKSVFETKNNEAINKNYLNKPVRKDVKKKAKSTFEES